MMSSRIAMIASRASTGLAKLGSTRTVNTSAARLSALDMKGLQADYKPDNLDKYILKRYGPKGKYTRIRDIPDHVNRDEMESAKSKFRVVVNIWAMIGCVATASWLIYFARSDKTKHNDKIAAAQKGN